MATDCDPRRVVTTSAEAIQKQLAVISEGLDKGDLQAVRAAAWRIGNQVKAQREALRDRED